MFAEALFTTAKIWKQPKCSSTDEWIKKMWYTYKMEYSSATEKNEILPFVTTWIDFEGRTKKNKHCMMSLVGRI